MSKSFKLNWGPWIYNLARAFIGGGAGAIAGGFASVLIDPQHFNLKEGLAHLFEMMGTQFAVCGTVHMMGILQKNALPDIEEGVTEVVVTSADKITVKTEPKTEEEKKL